jgi:hypothetical protein
MFSTNPERRRAGRTQPERMRHLLYKLRSQAFAL